MSRSSPCDAPACVTCGDVAEEARVLELDARSALARCVTRDGAELTVDAGLVPALAVGDLLLVHAGAALTRLDPGAAGR